MRDYKYFFSDGEIIRYLAKKRAKAAKDIHDNQFLRNISRHAKKPFNSEKKKQIYKYFPPRSCWIRFQKKERRQHSNSMSLNAAQLERTVWREHKAIERGDKSDQDWHQKLFKLIEEIKYRALSNEPKQLSSPELIPVVKSKEGNTYRLISSFEEVADKVIISQTARYLTEIFDSLFEDCSYAFRAKSDKNYTHHMAVREIINYKSNYNSQRLYAAESDIQKFYDSINHSIIKSRFEGLVQNLKANGVVVDRKAKSIFYAYLDCYAFNTDVHPKEEEILSRYQINEGVIAWVKPSDLKKVNSDVYNDRIGIPQGGALSCLIANIVLDYADKKLLNLNLRSLFYARFCDDIIIIHPQKTACNKAYNQYLQCLENLKLIAHDAEEFEKYDANFWKIKSKKPYVWNKLNKNHRLAKKNVPWLAFVGYQLRYDGLMRVRPSSIQKELEKQVEEANKVIKSLLNETSRRLKKKNIIFRFSQRLIAMSVGRVNSKDKSMCWSSGFNVLNDNPVREWQLRKLDKNRNLQISRVKKHLDKFDDNTKISSRNDKNRYRDFYGPPYSYYYQFVNKDISDD